jgi:transposase-like protein
MSTHEAPFVPPHCPRTDCRFHTSALGWHWVRHGWFSRQATPRRIPRFRCVHCGHTFSSQSFSTTYWLKRPDILVDIAERLLACSGYRQIARSTRCAPTTVGRHAARIGRHALLWLHQRRPPGPIAESVAIDGFEDFAYSQYHPLHLNLVVGSDSHYTYGFTHSHLRRKGRMTAAQKRRREKLEAQDGRAHPRSIEDGMLAALRLAAPEPQRLVVHSDDHWAYPRALRRLPGHDIVHRVISSREPRTAASTLFPVNLMDLLLRQNLACHKREGIAFAKLDLSVVLRAAWLVAWRNFTKPFSERHDGGTPAMRAGIERRPIPVREILEWRLFPARVQLPEPWASYYRGELRTPRIPNHRRHRLKLAV